MSADNIYMTPEIDKRLLECMDVLRSTHETFVRQGRPNPYALFDTIRVYMVAVAAYCSRNGRGELTDENLREILFGLLNDGIADYQFNERLHIHKDGSS